MKIAIKHTLCAIALATTTLVPTYAEEIAEMPAEVKTSQESSTTLEKMKSAVNVGLLLHTYLQVEQNGFGATQEDIDDMNDASARSYGANLYRARLMFDAQLTPKDYIFIDTELTASVGLGANKAASVKILDAQYVHTFSERLKIAAGKMLTSFNRNGLQSANKLMANDFAYFQYAYNKTSSQPLQNDSGRDIGVNLSGNLLANNRLSYRVGAFSGCRDYTYYTGEDGAPFRFVGRLQYNFFDIDNYAGTLLGDGRILSLAVGADNQGGYYALGGDLFLDSPLGSAGSVTLNAAYSYMTGGNYETKYNFASTIAESNIIFVEGGYYIKSLKLQPWIKFEKMNRRISELVDETVWGGGVNYFFNGYGSNIRLSYVARKNSEVGKYYGQTWLQLQFFIF